MSFDDVVSQFNKKYGDGVINKGSNRLEYDLIPFSSPFANYILHGGIPRGKVIEFFGGESGGKTTTAIDIMKNAQKIFYDEWEQSLKELEETMGGRKTLISKYNELKEDGPQRVVMFDLEQTFDEVWATTIGLDVENTWIIKPSELMCAEEILDLVIDLVTSKQVGLVVLDSIPALTSQKQLDESLSKPENFGGISKLLSGFFRKLLPRLNTAHCTLILINQLRDSMDPYKLYTTPGGRALKFYSAVRLMFNKGSLLGEDFEEIKRSSQRAYGNIVQIRLEKTKVCRPDRLLGSYTLSYTTGIESVVDAVDMLISLNMILRGGSWFTFFNADTGEVFYNESGNELKVQGRTNVIKYLKENDSLLQHYSNYLTRIINEK